MKGREFGPVWARGIAGVEVTYGGPWGLSLPQKRWLERAWVSEFGFVPEAIPRYTEERGFFYVPALRVHWHHIRGVAISIWYDGEDPHRPKNIVPLSARSHIGKGIGPWEDVDDEVIHRSALEALRRYAIYKEEGGRDPFGVMKEESDLLARLGIISHFDLWDRHFEELAVRVVGNYTMKSPSDLWPKIKPLVDRRK